MSTDVTIRNLAANAAREIKASAHYAYLVNGGTLDGLLFALGELVLEGQCLVRDDITGLYEKYVETVPGVFEPGKSNPVILDESIRFVLDDLGANPNVTFGQALVHGAVYRSLLIGVTDAFITALGGAVRIVA